MKVLMLSTDRTLLDESSNVSHRMQEYASFCESLTVVLAGRGKAENVARGNLRIVYPGGRTRAGNFLRMCYAARAVDASVVSAQDPFFTGLIAVLSGKRPLQIQMHTDHFGFLGSILARITLPRAQCVRVVSSHVADLLRPMTRAPISILPIHVDTERTQAKSSRPSEFGSEPAVLVVSRLAPEKRVHLVIRALREVPVAHLYIVGDGELRGSLERLATTLGLKDRIHFLGWRNDPTPYYQHADCFVQASAFEGYGLALVEAVLSGCPAVSTNVGVARDISQELVTISAADEYSLARAITSSLSQGSRAQGREARETFLRSFPTHHEYLARYKELLITCGTHSS